MQTQVGWATTVKHGTTIKGGAWSLLAKLVPSRIQQEIVSFRASNAACCVALNSLGVKEENRLVCSLPCDIFCLPHFGTPEGLQKLLVYLSTCRAEFRPVSLLSAHMPHWVVGPSWNECTLCKESNEGV